MISVVLQCIFTENYKKIKKVYFFIILYYFDCFEKLFRSAGAKNIFWKKVVCTEPERLRLHSSNFVLINDPNVTDEFIKLNLVFHQIDFSKSCKGLVTEKANQTNGVSHFNTHQRLVLHAQKVSSVSIQLEFGKFMFRY